MRNGGAELDAIIARVRSIPGLARRAAPDAARAAREVIAAQLAAGTNPEGDPWAPRKADNRRALEGAASALTVAAIGTRVFCKIAGHMARHSLGRAKGGVIRRMLPSRGIPTEIERRVRKVLTEHFERATKGAV